jgi:hypothetical protein
MRLIVALLLRLLTSRLRSNARDLEMELLVARQQLAAYQRSVPRPRLGLRDHRFWIWLSRFWSGWKQALVVVKLATVIAWRRRKFRAYRAKLSAKRGRGRARSSSVPSVPFAGSGWITSSSSTRVEHPEMWNST